MIKSNVFSRSGAADTMTRGAFYLVMTMILAWGFIATWIVSDMTAAWQPGTIELLLIGLGIPIVGILMSSSSNPLISFIGFNCVAIPFGAVLGPLLAMYTEAYPGIVGQAAILTAGVTGVMAVSGLLFPKFYESIGGALFGALTALVIVSVLSLFIPQLQQYTIIHYIAAGIFALYIGYDMHRAATIPATLDNAVDSALALYLDIINLFLRLLEILAAKKDD